KQVLGIAALLLLQSSLYAAGASRLTDVGLQSKDHSTTLTIRATGAFTHTEYRPTDNLLLVDLTGVSAAKMANTSRDLHGQFPGVESYHVVGYKGASGAETTRVELTLASNATVNVVDAKNAVTVNVMAGAQVATPGPEQVAAPTASPVAIAETSALAALCNPVRVRA